MRERNKRAKLKQDDSAEVVIVTPIRRKQRSAVHRDDTLKELIDEVMVVSYSLPVLSSSFFSPFLFLSASCACTAL